MTVHVGVEYRGSSIAKNKQTNKQSKTTTTTKERKKKLDKRKRLDLAGSACMHDVYKFTNLCFTLTCY